MRLCRYLATNAIQTLCYSNIFSGNYNKTVLKAICIMVHKYLKKKQFIWDACAEGHVPRRCEAHNRRNFVDFRKEIISFNLSSIDQIFMNSMISKKSKTSFYIPHNRWIISFRAISKHIYTCGNVKLYEQFEIWLWVETGAVGYGLTSSHHPESTHRASFSYMQKIPSLWQTKICRSGIRHTRPLTEFRLNALSHKGSN